MRDRLLSHWTWWVAALGVLGALLAAAVAPHQARAAAAQTWTPFVLVAGLLLIGLVAEEDGLFRSVGGQLARTAQHGAVLFLGSTLLIVIVTATLNLDTSVVFVTPVLLATARHRGGGERTLLYASLLLANASSLFLPGSNLTNLIVLGHQQSSGGAFLAHMWPAAVAGCAVTACGVAFWGRRDLAAPAAPASAPVRPSVGLGGPAVLLAVILVLVLRSPALPVAAVGLVAVVIPVAQRRITVSRSLNVLGLPVLVGLFGITVGLGTVGREWDGPALLLSHLGSAGTAIFAALLSVLFNNLPAAALLAARHSHHEPQLLIGLNLGPNLAASGSLAWFLWYRVARSSGAQPSLLRASRLGGVVVPLSMAAALAALALVGSG